MSKSPPPLQAGKRLSEAASALTQAARILLNKRGYKEAERLCEQAISLDPSSMLAYLELGRARLGQKRYDEALKTLEQAANLHRTVEVNIEMARAHFFSCAISPMPCRS